MNTWRNNKTLSREMYDSIASDERFGDEYIFRQMLHSLIQDMPIKELERIFQMEKLDPDSDEFERLWQLRVKGKLDSYEKAILELLIDLKRRRLVQFGVMTKNCY